MRIRAAISRRTERAATLGDQARRRASLVMPGVSEPMIDCPVRGETVAASTCHDCSRLVAVRRLDDGGGGVTMHVCDVRS